MKKTEKLITALGLSPHPEGGYYKEIYRAKDQVEVPNRFSNHHQKRDAATLIYFLMQGGNFSAFHRIKEDEIWVYENGGPAIIYMLDSKTKKLIQKTLGSVEKGDAPVVIVPHDTWFAAEVADKNSYTLAACFVAPAFEYVDFELAKRVELIHEFPEHAKLITRLTRE